MLRTLMKSSRRAVYVGEGSSASGRTGAFREKRKRGQMLVAADREDDRHLHAMSSDTAA